MGGRGCLYITISPLLVVGQIATNAVLSPRVLNDLQQLALVNIVTTRDQFNEGVDDPDVDMIVFMRVTHSRRIFVQQVNRGPRMAPNKSKIVVMDLVSDHRRIAEIVELDQALRGNIERLRLPGLVQVRDEGAGSFMRDLRPCVPSLSI